MTKSTTLLTASILLAAFLAGCSGTRSTVADPSTAHVYPLSEEQANQVVAEAMAAEFSGSAISRVDFPNSGYRVTIRFALDSHDIVALFIPAKARTTEGEIVDGYVFEVNDSGTMAISGRRRASKLFEGIQQRANRIAAPLPLAGY